MKELQMYMVIKITDGVACSIGRSEKLDWAIDFANNKAINEWLSCSDTSIDEALLSGDFVPADEDQLYVFARGTTFQVVPVPVGTRLTEFRMDSPAITDIEIIARYLEELNVDPSEISEGKVFNWLLAEVELISLAKTIETLEWGLEGLYSQDKKPEEYSLKEIFELGISEQED